MTELYGKRKVPKMLMRVMEHREAVASGDFVKTQETWDKVEEFIDFLFQEVAKND